MDVKKRRNRWVYRDLFEICGRCGVALLAVTCLLCVLSFSALGAEGGHQAKNAAYGKEKYEYLDNLCTQHYLEKLSGDEHLAEAQTCGVIQGYVSEIKALMFSADASSRSLEAEFDLLCAKGTAAGILSWIYYSNYDVRDIEGVGQVYLSRLDVIKNATDIYFFKNGDVEGCYTLLLQSVYSEKIKALSEEGDSPIVAAMIAAAPASMGAQCRYDTGKGGEDGDNYRAFYESTVKGVVTQRSRDAAKAQAELAFLKIFSGEEGRMPSALADFYNALNTKILRSEMNKLVSDTVVGFLTEAKLGKGEYVGALMDHTAALVINEAVRASGSDEIADIKSIIDDIPVLIRRADGKDRLVAYGSKTAENKNCSDELYALLFSGLDEYVKSGGLFDLAAETEVAEVLERGYLECDWFSFFADRLYEIENFLGGESSASVSAREKYTAAAVRIRGGELSEEELSEDKRFLEELVVEAEALRFETDHGDILNDAQIDRSDLSAIESAVKDAEALTSAAAKRLEVRLAYLLECCRTASVDAVLCTVREDGLKDRRALAAEALAMVLRELTADRVDGIVDLGGFLAVAKEYIKRAELTERLFDVYSQEYGVEGIYFLTQADAALESGIDEIKAGEGNEEKVSAYGLIFLRLASLEALYRSAEGYLEDEGIAAILGEAEKQIRRLEIRSEIEATVLEKTAEIGLAVRGICVASAKAEIGALVGSVLEKTENFEYISEEIRADLKERIELTFERANANIDSAADADSVAAALSAALAEISALEREGAAAEIGACYEYAKNALGTCFGAKEDFSDGNYALILELIRKYEEQLGEKSSVSEIKALLDVGIEEIKGVEDKLRAAKRTGLASLLATRDRLLEMRERYSPENASMIEDIYARTVSEIGGITEISKFESVIFLCAERELLMRGIPVNKVYTADGSFATDLPVYPDGYDAKSGGYFGAVFSESGLPSNSSLTIKSIDARGIEELIRKAARRRGVYLLGGDRADSKALRYLKNCVLCDAVDIDLGITDLASGAYRVTLLIPPTVDTSDILGAVFIGEDGRVEYYPLTVAQGMAEFETGHFSKYYIVRRGETDLTPWIVCLSIVVICELILVAVLLLYRQKRKREETLFLFAPFALAQGYRPVGAPVALGILAAAAVALGGIIAYLLALEIRDARKRRERSLPVRSVADEPVEGEERLALVEARPTEVLEEYGEEIYPEEDAIAVGEEFEDARGADAEEEADSSSVDGVSDSSENTDEENEELSAHILPSVSAEEADSLMSDQEVVMLRSETYGDGEAYKKRGRRAEVNLDAISAVFSDGDTVTIEELKKKGLVSFKAGRIKVLGRGVLDKRLTVIAEDFSASAEKMILLVGGSVVYKR